MMVTMVEAMDLVTLGEIMLRFTPPYPEVLEQAPVFEVRAAGAESNVAIVARRMGLRAGWISRLPNSPLGRRAAASVQQHGVDISRVIWAEDGRIGTYYIDPGVSPRPASVIYDRAHSAFTHLMVSEIDWDYICSARLLHFSGVTLALGSGLQTVVRHALTVARQKPLLVSFDINYRAKLWTAEQARQVLEPLLPAMDIVRAGLSEATLVLGIAGDAETVARVIYERFCPKVAIITDGSHQVVAWDGQLHQRTPLLATMVDPIGAGDAFMAGFLCGFLERDIEWGLDMAMALGALKHTYIGDIPWCARHEVVALIEQQQGQFR
jgi:2-dehydro-3-deoxygluconokinase